MAREGIPFVLVALILAVAVLLLRVRILSLIFAVILVVAAVFFVFFFRDPARVIKAGLNDIVSPVDGQILDISFQGDSQCISIFLSIFNVHITRCPHQGILKKMEYIKGQFLPAYREKVSELNERMILTVESPNIRYTLKLIAGVAARRIRMWIKEGSKLETGQKIGIIFFGSRAEIILPKNVRLGVAKNDRLRGGLTLIGNISNPR